MADLPVFFTSFRAFLAETNPPRTLAQGLASFVANLGLMDPRIGNAWMLWDAQAIAQNLDPFGITEADFRRLITNAIRAPNDVLDATQRFLNLSCATCLQIPAFILAFRHLLAELAMLDAGFPDGVLLVAVFIGMLPVTIRPYLLSRNHQNIEAALVDAATHAQHPPPATQPMQLGHIEEEAGAREETTAVARATEQILAALAQRVTTPVRAPRPAPAAGGAAAGGPPVRRANRLTPEERQRRIDNELCLYCGLHRAGTFCQADADKKAGKLRSRQGNV